MSDLISRQAVLKILNKVIIRYDELKPKYELIIIKSAMEKMADEIVKDLEKLPSVEPEKSECPWYGNDGKCHFAEQEMDECDDCISRKAAVEAVRDHDWMQAVLAIAHMPSVEPEWNPELRKFIEKVFETLREMDDAVDVICNLDVDAVLDRMEVTPNE